MKRCCTCRQTKQLSDFSKARSQKDGYRPDCKDCTRKYWYTESGIAAYKRYQQSTKGKARYKRYALRHPERIKAKKAISNAIYRNKLNRPETLHCIGCFEQAQEYHHPSYAPEQRFNVVPVCAECHRQIHSNLRP